MSVTASLTLTDEISRSLTLELEFMHDEHAGIQAADVESSPVALGRILVTMTSHVWNVAELPPAA